MKDNFKNLIENMIDEVDEYYSEFESTLDRENKRYFNEFEENEKSFKNMEY